MKRQDIKICLIAAMDRKGVIGRLGTLPWKLPSELQWFKYLTLGHPIVMGRKTWDSLPKRPLPGRVNIVITSTPQKYMGIEGAHFTTGAMNDTEYVASLAENFDGRIFVIGGESLYNDFLPYADELYITHVDADVIGDAYFPIIDPNIWEWNPASEYGCIPFEKSPSDEYSWIAKHYTRKGQ